MSQTSARKAGVGAYKAELAQIKAWIINNKKTWFTAKSVGIAGGTLGAMTRRNLLKTAGFVGSRQVYTLRLGGWVIE